MSSSKDTKTMVIGSLVEDAVTGELYQIIDKETNYITVATSSGAKKKWLNEITETEKETPAEFTLTESGQISCFGFTSQNLDSSISETLLEQLEELDDLYAQHQVLKCIDEGVAHYILPERRLELLERASKFFSKKDLDLPLVVEADLAWLESRKLAALLAEALDVELSTPQQVLAECIQKSLDMNDKQQAILKPLFSIADSYGLVSEDVYDKIFSLLEENISDIELEIEDIDEAFEESEFSDSDLSEEAILEVLSVQGRLALSRDLKRRTSSITIKRKKALNKSASTSELLGRARKLALTLIKRRMFRKPTDQLTRAEKERFELGAKKRKVLVARLAQKLVPKVRMLQSERLHGKPASTGSSQHKVKEVSGAS